MLRRKETLTTENLVLKSLEDSDSSALFSVLENPLVRKTYMSPVFESDDARNKFFLRMKEVSNNFDRFVYGIYLNKSLIGLINDVARENDEVEVGYCLHPDVWNKGYATEALKAAIQELFRIGFKTVVAAHFDGNLASGKVMQKSGMVRINRQEVIEYQGVKHQCIYYAITNK